MFSNYFKTAFRNLQKNKAHSLINLAGLSIGMMVSLLIGLWIWSELSFNKNFANYSRIAQVMQNQTFNNEVQTWQGVAMPLGEVLRKNYGENFKHVVISGWPGERTLEAGEKILKTSGNYMDPGVADMLSLDMISGSRTGLQDVHSILLSETVAKTYFGNETALNKIMKLEDKSEVKVTGVYRDLPENSSFASLGFIAPFDLMVINQNLKTVLQNPWGASWFQTYAQIADNADMATVSKKIRNAKYDNVSSEEAKKNKPEILLHPMSRWYLYGDFKNGISVGGRILYVWLFGITGVFVLLLACINFTNLSTARSEKRAKEVGIRKTIGALRRQLVYQFLSESVMLAVVAFLLALLLTQALLPAFNHIAGKHISIDWSNPYFWSTGIVFCLLTGVLAGAYPSLYLSRIVPVKVLKGAFRAGNNAALPRKILVVVQFTVSIILIAGTLVVYRQINHTRNRPIGYNNDNLITISSENIHQHFASFRNELLKTGAIAEVAQSEVEITNTYITNSGFNWQGKDPSMQEEFTTLGVTPEFGKTVNWQIIEGRDFSRDFASDSMAIIINEAAKQYLGFEEPVGKTLDWGGDEKVHIIGVVKNMITQNPYEPVKQSFFYIRDGYLANINIKVKAGEPMVSALAVIEKEFKKYNPSQPFKYQFSDEMYAKNFDNEVRVGQLATLFALLAIFISSLGVFGVASFVIENRNKELAVRKVLGASVFGLWQLLNKEFVLLVLVSCGIALPLAAYAMNQWLQHYAYRTTMSWWIFLVSGGGALVITLATVSIKAIKAAMANPSQRLRGE